MICVRWPSDCNSFQLLPNLSWVNQKSTAMEKILFQISWLNIQCTWSGSLESSYLGLQRNIPLAKVNRPPFHPGSLAKNISAHLILWHYLGDGHWWQMFFFQWLLCIRLKRFRPAVAFCRWPLNNQKVLTVFAIFWKFWCLISAKLENKCWPLPNNLLGDYLFRSSHRMQYSFHQYTKQSQVMIKLVADCMKTRIC